MIIPATGGAPPPSPDLPESVRADYDEARAVAGRSRRAAAALLRVAVENLCIHLNGPQRNLDEHVGLLVAKGLAEETAEMFDAVRLVGNNAAHPIDRIGLDECPEIVQTLFWLVNEIARDVITRPNNERQQPLGYLRRNGHVLRHATERPLRNWRGRGIQE